MDLISQLPEPIRHDILRCLPPKEAIRTCVLSKTWKLRESRNPSMHFFYTKHGMQVQHVQAMLTCAENHLESFAQNNDSGSLFFTLHLFSSIDHVDLTVDSLLKRLMTMKTTKLILCVPGYSFPLYVLHSETLSILDLNRCKLEHGCGDNNIWLPKLVIIKLCNVDFKEGFIEGLIHRCPLLCELNFIGCYKLATLRVTGHVRLKCVAIIRCKNLIEVEIQSPNILHSIHYAGLCTSRHCHLTFAPTMNLILESVKIESGWLRRQVYRCKELTLDRVDCIEGIEISSTELSKLIIHNTKNMKKVAWICCPNLQSLTYAGNPLPFCSASEFRLLKDIRIEFRRIRDHRLLKDLCVKLCSNKELNVKQVVHCEGGKDLIILDGLSDFVIPENFDIKDFMPQQNVFVKSISRSHDLNYLVKYICKHLKFTNRSLYVVSTKCCNSNFSMVLFDKLTRIRAEANCYKDIRDKSWRHYL